ncbi:MAG: hypothetical protein OXP75_00325 [Rhodospirillales bacterium]|nr:hypothetical protein [Rhodospirillales bacterium]
MATDSNTDAERIRQLEDENVELRTQLKEYGKTQEELWSHKIYSEARKSFVTWLKISSGPFVALIALGGYFGGDHAITNMLSTATDAIQTKVEEEVSSRLSEVSDSDISAMFREELRVQIKSEVSARLVDVDSKLSILDHSIGSVREVLESEVLKSKEGQFQTSITFTNRMQEAINVYWVNYEGNRKFYRNLGPQEHYTQPTYVTHPWVVATAEDNQFVTSIVGMEKKQSIYVNGVGNVNIIVTD